MIDHILLCERQQQRDTEQLYPFSLLHPAWELRIGAHKQYEKIARLFPQTTLHYTSHRHDVLASFYARYSYTPSHHITGSVLVLFADILCTATSLRSLIQEIKHGIAQEKYAFRLISATNKQPLGYYLHGVTRLSYDAILTKCIWDIHDSISCSGDYPHLQHLWDIFPHISSSIADDCLLYSDYVAPNHAQRIDILRQQNSHLVAPENIYIVPTATIASMTVLDASDGAIIIDDGATIMPMTSIIGPCYIGKNSIVRAGSTLYHDTVIGERCKIGGEIENSIVQGYSNKQHYGFMGHSFLGEWVNLGAGTTTSDLKNNYGDIRITFPEREINSGRMFLGLLCGDHSKAAINTSFSTGTVVGISSNIFGGEYPERFVQSFSWGGKKDSTVFDITQAIGIAQRVMARRQKILLPEEESLLRKEFAEVMNTRFL